MRGLSKDLQHHTWNEMSPRTSQYSLGVGAHCRSHFFWTDRQRFSQPLYTWVGVVELYNYKFLCASVKHYAVYSQKWNSQVYKKDLLVHSCLFCKTDRWCLKLINLTGVAVTDEGVDEATTGHMVSGGIRTTSSCGASACCWLVDVTLPANISDVCLEGRDAWVRASQANPQQDKEQDQLASAVPEHVEYWLMLPSRPGLLVLYVWRDDEMIRGVCSLCNI